MTRANCMTPDNCFAPKRGDCKCAQIKHSPEAIAKMRKVFIEQLPAYQEARSWGASSAEARKHAQKKVPA